MSTLYTTRFGALEENDSIGPFTTIIKSVEFPAVAHQLKFFSRSRRLKNHHTLLQDAELSRLDKSVGEINNN